MKFKALPITDLTDVTIDLEQLQTLDILNETAESFPQLVTPGTVGVAFGLANGVFPGASISTTPLVVSHGIGRSPFPQVTSTNQNVHYAVTARSSSTITVTGETLDGSTPAAATSIPFFWLAYG